MSPVLTFIGILSYIFYSSNTARAFLGGLLIPVALMYFVPSPVFIFITLALGGIFLLMAYFISSFDTNKKVLKANALNNLVLRYKFKELGLERNNPQHFLKVIMLGDRRLAQEYIQHFKDDPENLSYEEDGWDALKLAIYYGHNEILNDLLRFRNVESLVKEGKWGEQSLLRKAYELNHLSIVETLKNYGAVLTVEEQKEVISERQHDLEGLQKLFQTMNPAREVLNDRFQKSIKNNGDLSIINLFLKNGSDPFLEDDEGYNAFDHAFSKNNYDQIEIFLDTIDITENYAFLHNFLLQAVSEEKDSLVILLNKKGISLTHSYENEPSALEYAIVNSRFVALEKIANEVGEPRKTKAYSLRMWDSIEVPGNVDLQTFCLELIKDNVQKWKNVIQSVWSSNTLPDIAAEGMLVRAHASYDYMQEIDHWVEDSLYGSPTYSKDEMLAHFKKHYQDQKEIEYVNSSVKVNCSHCQDGKITCLTCDGRKRVDCKECDRGLTICDTCDGCGEYEVECDVCNSEGTYKCPSCSFEQEVDCTIKDCIYCEGIDTHKCEHCVSGELLFEREMIIPSKSRSGYFKKVWERYDPEQKKLVVIGTTEDHLKCEGCEGHGAFYCEECDREGHITIECRNCRDGYVRCANAECHNGIQICDDCNGGGYHFCEECNATGEQFEDHFVKVTSKVYEGLESKKIYDELNYVSDRLINQIENTSIPADQYRYQAESAEENLDHILSDKSLALWVKKFVQRQNRPSYMLKEHVNLEPLHYQVFQVEQEKLLLFINTTFFSEINSSDLLADEVLT
ncbi:hypothetical protein [Pontibacillus marinus]|uniref:hypothetical protein n=1 Tax=Pontibacillus marinus TaxID=273164 RepID=UPI0018CE3E7A|nr:hypothetical protein [Pontibacillus marinus]